MSWCKIPLLEYGVRNVGKRGMGELNNFKLILILVCIVWAIVSASKEGVKIKEGNYEDVIPFALFETGMVLTMAGVFKIDPSIFAMYAMSGETEKLSIINYISNSKTEFALIGVGTVFIIMSFISFKTLNGFRGKKLLNIQAYDDNKLEFLSIKKVKGKLVEGQYIDLTEMWKEGKSKKASNPELKKIIERMVRIINDKVILFKGSSQNYKRAFTGIAPIPLLIYTGRIIPKLGFSDYLELQKLNNENELIPLDTSGKVQYPSLQISDCVTSSNTDEEVLVAVSTTKQIDDSELTQFLDKGIEVKHIYLRNPGHGSIISVKQINEYAETIINGILNIKCLKPNLKIIHLVCASKPSLVFRVGQLIDDTQMPIIISYQLSQQDEYKYPWGLYINHCQKQGQFFRWK
jgi:hypothetical protein